MPLALLLKVQEANEDKSQSRRVRAKEHVSVRCLNRPSHARSVQQEAWEQQLTSDAGIDIQRNHTRASSTTYAKKHAVIA